MNKFYAVVGANGVAAVNSIEKADHEMIYLRGHRYMKKFVSFKEATDFALLHLATIAPQKKMPVELPLNYIVLASALDGVAE